MTFTPFAINTRKCPIWYVPVVLIILVCYANYNGKSILETALLNVLRNYKKNLRKSTKHLIAHDLTADSHVSIVHHFRSAQHFCIISPDNNDDFRTISHVMGEISIDPPPSNWTPASASFTQLIQYAKKHSNIKSV